MNRGDEQALWILGGLYLLSKYSWNVAPKLERAGATLYDVLHDDAGHKNDLPGHQLTRAALLAIATKAGFPDPKLASAIALAESGGVPGAVLRSSRENSIGLWQINLKAHPQFSEADMKDPMKNALAAMIISKRGTDWSDWSAYTHNRYQQFQTGILA